MSDPRAYAVLGQDTARHRVLLTILTPVEGIMHHARCIECGWQQTTATEDHAMLLGHEHRHQQETP